MIIGRRRSRTNVLFASLAAVAFFVAPTIGWAGRPPELPAADVIGGRSDAEILAFRSEFGLATNLASVREAVRYDPAWGVPLTPAESDDLADRARIQDALAPLEARLEGLPRSVYGGLYLDQKMGGTVVVAVAGPLDEAAVASLVASAPAGAEVELRPVRYTKAELDATRAALEPFAGKGVSVLWTDLMNNVVVVGVKGSRSAELEVSLAAAGPMVSVFESSGVETAVCSNRASCTPYRAGLHIYRADSASCTGGFMAKNSSGSQYWLTAGHCGAISTQWFHDEAGVGTTSIRYYSNNGHADAAGITRPTGQMPWIFVTGGEPARPVTARQGANADNPGESVCQSGFTTGFFCGVIYGDDVTVTDNNNITLLHMRVASIHVQGGDSGGPTFYGNTAKGIVEGFVPGVYCGQYQCGVYSHINEVESHLAVTVLTQ